MPTAVLHEFSLALKVPGGLLKPQTVESHTRISNSVLFRWKQKICISSDFSGGLVTTGAKTTALEPLGQQLNTLAHPVRSTKHPPELGNPGPSTGSLPGMPVPPTLSPDSPTLQLDPCGWFKHTSYVVSRETFSGTFLTAESKNWVLGTPGAHIGQPATATSEAEPHYPKCSLGTSYMDRTWGLFKNAD